MPHVIENTHFYYKIFGEYGALFDELGLTDSRAIFEDPRVRVWRTLDDRENATLDATLAGGGAIRLHVKRYGPQGKPGRRPADDEMRGAQLLRQAGIPTIPLAAAGVLPDGRNFVVTEHLYGYEAADKLLESRALKFDALLEPTAEIAGKLHAAGLHHRDLYLCHFFVKADGGAVQDVRLIDVARVAKLPRLFKRRWVVKDLAQFWYSTRPLPITDAERERWLARYTEHAGLYPVSVLRPKIDRKVAWIARHDAKLRAKQPNRNISIAH